MRKIIGAGAILLCLGGVFWLSADPLTEERSDQAQNQQASPVEGVAVSVAAQPQHGGAVLKAGVAGGLAEAGSWASTEDRASASDNPFIYGTTPTVANDANPRVASAAEALASGTQPERLSIVHSPAAFDLAAYERDPQAYLQVVEPGRVMQAAQPGKDVPVLRALTTLRPKVAQGDQVALRVAVPAGMPVTFTSMDLGIFAESNLTSVTVAADAAGVAEVSLMGTPGTIGDVTILCASPKCSGQVRFIARVDRPDTLAVQP